MSIEDDAKKNPKKAKSFASRQTMLCVAGCTETCKSRFGEGQLETCLKRQRAGCLLYTETLIPRGLIGRLGKVAGSRALVLLHDEQGHPLLVTTHRGDLHLTHGIPQILTCYEQVAETIQMKHLVVDREAMAAGFLAQLNTEGRTLTTILKTNQYSGLDDFLNVGPFVPLTLDHQGAIVREVAPAQFWLPRPDRQDEPLLLSVALIRDLRKSVLCSPREDELPRSWHADIRHEEVAWWQKGWQATAAPA
jgi:hypothetical protein